MSLLLLLPNVSYLIIHHYYAKNVMDNMDYIQTAAAFYVLIFYHFVSNVLIFHNVRFVDSAIFFTIHLIFAIAVINQ